MVERFTPIIGDISLAREMKAALQEAEEAEDAERQSRSKDAKGREIMSPEEKGKRKEKEQQKAAEARKWLVEPKGWNILLKTLHKS